MSFTLVLTAALIGLAGILAYLLYCVALRARRDNPDPQWLQSFSVERYRPMLRLLSESDYIYLSSQGVDSAATKRLRAERRRVFGIYLSNLVRDFNRLHWAAQTVLLASEADNPGLSERLVRTKARFQRTVMLVRFRLLLNTLGLGGVEAGTIIDALELVNSDFRSLIALNAASLNSPAMSVRASQA